MAIISENNQKPVRVYTNSQFRFASVYVVITFVVLAVVSLITYRSSGSYKDEEAFK